MAYFFEFISVNWLLAAVFVALVVALYAYESFKSGKSVGTQGLSDLVNKQQGVVLDVRDNNEFKKGHIIGAINIPVRQIEERLSELNKHQQNPIIVVCKIGQSSTAVTKTLKANGFQDVYKLTGGMTDWEAANLPVVKG